MGIRLFFSAEGKTIGVMPAVGAFPLHRWLVAAAAAAVERPGLTSVALALAEILDDPRHVASQPAAARQLVAILGTL